jgi:hypothetical protein
MHMFTYKIYEIRTECNTGCFKHLISRIKPAFLLPKQVAASRDARRLNVFFSAVFLPFSPYFAALIIDYGI